MSHSTGAEQAESLTPGTGRTTPSKGNAGLAVHTLRTGTHLTPFSLSSTLLLLLLLLMPMTSLGRDLRSWLREYKYLVLHFLASHSFLP